MSNARNYIQARNLLEEARTRLKDFEAIMGRVRKEFDSLRETGVSCPAFKEDGEIARIIQVTKQCWNHLFKHPIKRPSRVEKLERALCFDMAVKLLQKTTTYQEVSKEKNSGGSEYLYFGIIGYIRGNRIKVIIRKQLKHTNPQYVLFSFYQMSSGPLKNAPRIDS